MLIMAIVAIVMSMTSCATILDGRKNTIKVEMGSPEAAQVFLDGEYIGESPFKIRISKFKLQEGSLIEIKKEGYETLVYKVHRSPHIGYVVADMLTGVIPLIVDVADGNIYRPNTRKIEYELIPFNRVQKQSAKTKLSPKQ